MKIFLRTSLLTSLILNSLLLSSALFNRHLVATETVPTQTSETETSLARTPLTKSSILQTAIVPYLVSQDCSTQYQSSQEQLIDAKLQINTAELLLSATAIPNASTVDSILAELFSLAPCTVNCAGYSPNEPLIDQINNGLIPYLQNSLANLGELNEIVQIAAGGNHTVVLTGNGKVYACGDNTDGQLGIGVSGGTRTTFTAMIDEGSSGVIAIAAGRKHTVVLKNGAAYATGLNDLGQLGVGDTLQRDKLTKMNFPGDSGVTAIAAGWSHTVVLKTDKAYATGSNSDGQLGIGDTVYTQTAILTLMVGEQNSDISDIACGGYHTVALKNNGIVYAVGLNGSGQLGIGSFNDYRTTLTAMTDYNSSVTAIAGGRYHTIVLKNGAAYGTGLNNSLQLGLNDALNRNTLTPIPYEGVSGISAIAAGQFFTIVLKTNGSVYATGANVPGQLGIGTPASAPILTAMLGEGEAGVTAVSAGESHTIALKSNGAICATGNNGQGQLGVNYFANTRVLINTEGSSKVFYNFN